MHSTKYLALTGLLSLLCWTVVCNQSVLVIVNLKKYFTYCRRKKCHKNVISPQMSMVCWHWGCHDVKVPTY